MEYAATSYGLSMTRLTLRRLGATHRLVMMSSMTPAVSLGSPGALGRRFPLLMDLAMGWMMARPEASVGLRIGPIWPETYC